MTLTMNDIETKERIYHGLAYREVSAEVLHQIIDSGGWDKNKGFVKYSPIGAFLGVENGVYVAIDNETGDAWTEEFYSKTVALNWLLFNKYGSVEDAHDVDLRTKSRMDNVRLKKRRESKEEEA